MDYFRSSKSQPKTNIKHISVFLSYRVDDMQFLGFLIKAHALIVIMQHRCFLNCLCDKQKQHPEEIACLQEILDSLPRPVYENICDVVPEIKEAFGERHEGDYDKTQIEIKAEIDYMIQEIEPELKDLESEDFPPEYQ